MGKFATRAPLAVLACLILLGVAACGPFGTQTTTTMRLGYHVTACGSSLPLATTTSPAPIASPSLYIGTAGIQDTQGQSLYALDPAGGATRWCDHFATSNPGGCVDNACAPPPTVQLGTSRVAEGVVYVCVTGAGGFLYALNAADGALRWSRETDCGRGSGFGYTGTPLLVGSRVYSGNDALDATTGQIVWQARPPLEFEAAAQGLIYGVGGEQGMTIAALDLATGAVRWQQTMGAAGSGALAASDNLVLVALAQPDTNQADFYALDAGTGAVRWRALIDGNDQTLPLAAGHLVFANTPDGLVALAMMGGQVRWRVPAGRPTQPIIAGSVLYVGTEGADVVDAIDLASGAVRWRWQPPHAQAFAASAPTLLDGTLYVSVAYHDGTAPMLYALDAATGAIRWQRTDLGGVVRLAVG